MSDTDNEDAPGAIDTSTQDDTPAAPQQGQPVAPQQGQPSFAPASTAPQAGDAGAPSPPISSDNGAAGAPMVTVNYTLPGDKTPHVMQLTQQQFAQYLHPGQDGQYDKLQQTSIPGTLQRIAGSTSPSPGAASNPNLARAEDPDKTSAAPAAGSGPSDGSEQPGTVERPEYQSPIFKGKLSDDQEQERQSYAMFPRAALDANENAKREAWLSGQQNQEAERQVKTDVANIAANSRINVGNSKADAWRYSSDAKVKAAQAAQAMKQAQAAQVRGDKSAATNYGLYAKLQLAGASIPPKLQQFVEQHAGEEEAAPRAAGAPPVPQAGDPQKGLQQTAAQHPPPAQRPVGYTVTTQKGTFKWNGQGWDPQGQQ